MYDYDYMKESMFEAHHIQSVTIQQIRCFAAVAKSGTYARAEGLGIAQPAVSRAVMRLEEILGAKLFERGKRTALTGFGEKMLVEARRILGMVESLKQLALDEAGRGRITGVVTIGTKSILAETILPGLIAKFRRHHRRAAIRIRCGRGADLLDMLCRGEIDMAVSHGCPCPEKIAFRRLGSYPRLLVARKAVTVEAGVTLPKAC